MARTTRKVYYSISEVEKITGIKQHILRFWENEFAVLKPKRSRSGIRAYQERDIQTILIIKNLLYNQKFTIEGARKKFREDKEMMKKKKAPIDRLETQVLLKEIKNELLELKKMLGNL